MSPSNFCEGPQKSSTIFPDPLGSGFLSGLIDLIMHTASITNFITGGGFFIAFTKVISEGFKVFRAKIAASSAGIASARSLSQSSLIA